MYAPPQEKGVCLRMHNNGPDLYMQRRKKRIKIKCLTRIRHQQHPNRALPKNVSNASRHNLVHIANKSVDQLPLVFLSNTYAAMPQKLQALFRVQCQKWHRRTVLNTRPKCRKQLLFSCHLHSVGPFWGEPYMAVGLVSKLALLWYSVHTCS